MYMIEYWTTGLEGILARAYPLHFSWCIFFFLGDTFLQNGNPLVGGKTWRDWTCLQPLNFSTSQPQPLSCIIVALCVFVAGISNQVWGKVQNIVKPNTCTGNIKAKLFSAAGGMERFCNVAEIDRRSKYSQIMFYHNFPKNRTKHMSCHSELFVVCDIGDFSWMVRGDLVNGPLTITLGTLKLATHWDGRGREIKMLTRKRVLRERVVDWDKLWYICYRGREGEQATPSAKSPPIREAIHEKRHIFFGQYP